MLIRSSIQFMRLGVALAATIGLASNGSLAGEKIRFTDQSEKIASPGKGLKEDFSRPFDLKRSGPSGAEVAPLPPPSPSGKTRDPKVDEWIDQKKNWIFNTPSKLDSEAVLKEIFNVREYKFDELGSERKSKSAIDRYFERAAQDRKEISARYRGNAKDRTTANDRDAETSRIEDDRAEEDSITALPTEPGAPSSISPGTELDSAPLTRRGAQLGDPLSVSPGDIMPRNFNSAEVFGMPRRSFGGGSGQFTAPNQRELRMQEFQKMLGATPVKPGLLADPINLQRDATRQAINPVAGGGPSSLSLDTGLSGIGAVQSAVGRLPISEAINPQLPSRSSLAPGVIMPSSPSFVHRPPAVLEIPRRKF